MGSSIEEKVVPVSIKMGATVILSIMGGVAIAVMWAVSLQNITSQNCHDIESLKDRIKVAEVESRAMAKEVTLMGADVSYIKQSVSRIEHAVSRREDVTDSQ